MIEFRCPFCQVKIKARDEKAGTASRCPKCREPLQVPKRSGLLAADPFDQLFLETTAEEAPAVDPDPPAMQTKPVASGFEFETRPNGIPRYIPPQRIYARPPKNPAASAIQAGIVGALFMSFVGGVSSQYFPVFGGVLEMAIAQPWSPARMGLIPVHIFGFALAGFFVGAALGYLHGSR